MFPVLMALHWPCEKPSSACACARWFFSRFSRFRPPTDWHVSYELKYEGGSESSVIGVITLSIDMIDCCIIP